MKVAFCLIKTVHITSYSLQSRQMRFKYISVLCVLAITIQRIDEADSDVSELLRNSFSLKNKNWWLPLNNDAELVKTDEKTYAKYDLKTLYTKPYSIKQMRGVNRAGFEYACAQGWGITDGPIDDASIKAMKNWNVEVVRLPLNEDCWLSINGMNAAVSGDNYRSTVADYVKRLRSHGLKVILDLHFSDGQYNGPGWVECSDYRAACKKPMPDAKNAPTFWKSVANKFKNDEGVIFDLFNNPDPGRAIYNADSAWKCWRDGGKECPEFPYKVAGMQDLVDSVRQTGANNPLMVGGIGSANDLSKFLQYVPKDPKGKIIASWHSWKDHQCNNKKCWEREIAPVVDRYSVIVSEIGEGGCSHDYSSQLMDWLDKKKISYLSWTWNTWHCSDGGLISDYKGTPTKYGEGLYNRIAKKSASMPLNKGKSQGKGNFFLKKQLRGVNRSGAEYSCVKNLGIFEGPVDENSIKSMKKWKINVVRVPLNEDCWLGINGHRADLIGPNYRNDVITYVKRLRNNGISVILDLHWSGGLYSGAGHGECVDVTAKCQKPMPDAQYAPMFWRSVANQFSGDDDIIFDLYNEPFPDMIYWDKSVAWQCWRQGGSACPGFPFQAAGMQDLVNAVREVGATNPVMIGGINWSSDLWLWKEYVPTDPLNKIIASWHAYALNPCNEISCWEPMIGPIVKEYPVVVGEIGETDCTAQYINKLMAWLDQKGISYVGWTWNTWDCRLGPALITDYDGTPTDFGKGLMKHLKR